MKVYNSISRAKEEFRPRQEGKVSMYVCGPTVYNHIHIGNARTFMSFDVIRRYLVWRGYDVTFIQNVTDVDDKIINRANEEGRSAGEVAEEYTNAFIAIMRKANVMDPTVRPKATETIDDMIALIERLIAKGHAYEIEGDVYFSVRSFPSYGKLSGRDIDDMRSGARVDIDERKQDPLDFALWKAAKPGEPSWVSPWGLGRPGWHIECSSMAQRELGLPFDIHGGGSDLTFPHHENEIAQSEADAGVAFANYWMHGGMLQINSEKMSKSLNNFLLLKDVLAIYSAPVLRLLMLQTHYRSPLDFSEDRMQEAQSSFDRITTFIRNVQWAAAEQTKSTQDAPARDSSLADSSELSQAIETARVKFVAEMDDDFNTAGALGALFELIKVGNGFLAQIDQTSDAAILDALLNAASTIVELLGALGVVVTTDDELPSEVVDLAKAMGCYAGGEPQEAVDALLVLRAQARQNKEWAVADGVRDGFAAIGLIIEDTAQGARVSKRPVSERD